MATNASADENVAALSQRVENSLSINPDAVQATSQSGDSAQGQDTQARTAINAIGSGGGGPPPRPSPTSLSSSSGGSSPAIRPGGPSNVGTGGPGSRSMASERARQMASTRLPPSLQARLAANVNRNASSSSSPSTASPAARESSNSPFGSIGPDTKLDMNAFTGKGASPQVSGSSSPHESIATASGNFRIPAGLRPAPGLPTGAVRPHGPLAGAAGLGSRRKGPGLRLSDIGDGTKDESDAQSNAHANADNASKGGANGSNGGRRLAPPGKLASAGKGLMSNAFEMHKDIVDPSGRLRFDGKAVLSASGVEFRNGTTFNINMEELDLLDELGKGAYGTVRKVRHTKTHVLMAMKEIRLELDDSKLNGIIMELDILHRATAPEIVEFYGAFFYESCVYYCIEFMDAGSLENLYDGRCSVPEDVLARIVGCTVRGLRFLKDNLQIMHRDVKPTNILLNQAGDVKLCDFGVSGQLEKSLAKTNIGCQSYMAPERIKGESQNLVGTYTVASDVWSLGLTIVETTLGTYPYPPETYSNVFAQLQAIVHGDPPQIPGDFYSDTARDFVAGCLEKVPAKRSTYKQMLEHPWLVQDRERGREGVQMAGWIRTALERRSARREKERSEAVIG